VPKNGSKTGKIRISKSEIRTKFKSENEHQIQNELLRIPGFGFSEFEIYLNSILLRISCFEFRI